MNHASSSPGLLGSTTAAVALIEVTNLPEVGAELGTRVAGLFHDTIDARIRSLADHATVESTAGRWIVTFDGPTQTESWLDDAVRRLASGFDRPLDVDGYALHAIVHIGVGVGGDAGETATLHDAEVALHQGIEHNVRITRYDPSATQPAEKLTSNSTALGELSKAVWEGGLFVEYQPKVDLQSLLLDGCEALVRWAHPVYGRVGPNDFIEMAERSDLVRPLTFHVLEEALATAAELRGGPLSHISVNVSSMLLRDDDFVREAIAVVRGSGVAPDSVEFEITERAIARLASIDALETLRAAGIRIAVDDFGVGYSSLSTVANLPVDVIKLDRSFIAGIDTNRVNQLAVGAVVELAGECGRETVAEGIETHQELDTCATLGVNGAQGFLFSPPIPGSELVELVRAVAS